MKGDMNDENRAVQAMIYCANGEASLQEVTGESLVTTLQDSDGDLLGSEGKRRRKRDGDNTQGFCRAGW